ncbi:uncharacterized protein [Mytilus edulis]|uniref:uncharacterized protein n=1 Tax=Mytilus edulis TaxID=6550 RepID=UPI0039EED31A
MITGSIAHDLMSDCVHFYFGRSGSLTSNNYGSQFYKPGIDCVYIIKPPKAIYKIEIVDLQMADAGDFIQVNDEPNGQVLGHFSGFSGTPFLLFSDKFYIRYKTNEEEESKGFNLTWSVATVMDTVRVSCASSGWLALVNLTSLKYVHPDTIQPDKIVINVPSCYGSIFSDLVIFRQNYTTCSSNRTIENSFVIYRNKLVYLDHGITKWTVPLECKKQRTTRIANFHLYSNKRALSLDNKSVFNFSVVFFYDRELKKTGENPYAFQKLYVYEITLMDNDEDLTFEVESCSTHQSKNGKTLSRQHVENAQPTDDDVTLTKMSRVKTLVSICITEDLATMFTCDIKIMVQ